MAVCAYGGGMTPIQQPFPGWYVQATGWTAQRLVDGEPRGATHKAATLDALGVLIGTGTPVSGDDSTERGHQIAELKNVWGDPYEIGWDGTFWCKRRDNGAVLQCETSAALLREMRLDYTAHPVPREFHQA